MSPKNEWPSHLVARLRTARWLYNAILGSLEAGWRNQRGGACGNVDHSRDDGLRGLDGRLRLGDFPVERKLVEHVSERFGMHQAVFDGYVQQSVQGKL